MKEAGIENPSKFIFGSNQSGKANGTGRGHGDEDYVPCNGEKRMSDSDNDGSSSSQVNKVHHPPTTFQTTPVVSPSSINTHSNSNKCKLLDWMGTGEVVAEGYWSSSDPKALVHHIPIGPNAVRVWADVANKSDFFLWRTTSDMEYVKDAVGTTVA